MEMYKLSASAWRQNAVSFIVVATINREKWPPAAQLNGQWREWQETWRFWPRVIYCQAARKPMHSWRAAGDGSCSAPRRMTVYL